jgi:uncharacterized protein DUF1553/uncharacterized protein DUF1549/cytochrome c
VQRRYLICWLVLVLLFGNSLRSAQAADASVKFFRGLNLNGPAVIIDDQQWEGQDASNYTCNGKAFDNQSVPLKPPTDLRRARMIRSSRWGGDIDVELSKVPRGTYQVLLYVWEDNDAETYDILLNERVVVQRFNSGTVGTWKRLGPWKVEVREGTIKLSARGGAANLSGIEVWSGEGAIPHPESLQFASTLTDEQLAFFEKRIRPLLVERCHECHSATAKEIGGNLLLDSRPGIVKGGDNGSPIVPGDPEASLLMTAVRYTNPDFKMPPNKKLSDAEIADLAAWITMRAPDPRINSTIISRKTIDVTEARTRWPFAAVADPPVPTVRDEKWPHGDVDRFLRAAQEAKGLKPVGDAERRVLIRRATFDLIGLPPAPDEVTAFVDDAADTPAAFAKVVDRLLESPYYGERWGRHWLDVVRYADTAGDNSDYPIPQMIKYRDWVIDAFNRDLPYDQFIREQLAGDLLDRRPDPLVRPGNRNDSTAQDNATKVSTTNPGRPDQGVRPTVANPTNSARTIATGYIALARRFGSRVDDYPQHLTIEDTIDNLGRAFLGLSLSCGRCHDHKFDPIGTDDYYALYGIFQSTRYPWPGIELEKKQRDLVPLAPGEVVEAATRERKAKLVEFDAELKRLDEEKKKASENQKKEIDKRIGSTKKQRDDLNNSPPPYDTAYAVAEGKKIENARIQIKGNPEKAGDEVPRRFLAVLGGQSLLPDEKSSGRRQLAEWISSPDNPLTARVMVNRVWLHHFGQGLVPTPNDFGKQGRPPTHPELLDWLSRRFVDSGWSVKEMHRLMMNSRMYQLSSVGWAPSPSSSSAGSRDVGNATGKSEGGRPGRPSYETLDPSNDLLTHFRRRRLDAESLRDTLLVLSGQLEPGPGGPHPFPPQKDWNFTQHKPFKEVYDSNRRSVYLMTQRIQRHPYLAIFDGADTSASTSTRGTSTTTLQALYLLNDSFVHDQAKYFAARLEQAAPMASARLELVHQLALGRPITSPERIAAESYLVQAKERLAAANVPADQHDPLAWQSYARAIFRLNEFVSVE